jgi:DNA repair protein RecN (Recombination protein N)
MLSRLFIKGFAIIEDLDMTFSSGLNIITGETGAGKSILIKALGLLFGAKSSAKTVHGDVDSTLICGEFLVRQDHPALAMLDEHGIPRSGDKDGEQIFVRRKIYKTGRSQIWVNDVAVTLEFLKSLSPNLIDIFGQHGTMHLFELSQHLAYVDKFVAHPVLKQEIRDAYQECMASIDELGKIVETFAAKNRDKDYLTFRIKELDEFDPSIEDYEYLLEQCKLYENQLKVQGKLTQVQSYIDGGEEYSVTGNLRAALKILDQGADEFYSMLAEKLRAVTVGLDEISFEVEKKLKKSEFDEDSYASSQERIAKYQDLQRRFGVRSIEEVIAEGEKFRDQLDFLESAVTSAKEIFAKLEKAIESLNVLCSQLREERSAAGLKAAKYIQKELGDLGIPEAKLEIELMPVRSEIDEIFFDNMDASLNPRWQKIRDALGKVGPSGSERAQILFSANKGMPPLPLQKVASGGEISRIMLAIKRALTVGAESCVLVFDEIDTGISGQQADQVGQKIKQLSSSYQILCISHLAQVAAYAESHFLVEKVDSGDKTISKVLLLTSKDSIREIARLLSGPEITKESLSNARSLQKRAEAK